MQLIDYLSPTVYLIFATSSFMTALQHSFSSCYLGEAEPQGGRRASALENNQFLFTW